MIQSLLQPPAPRPALSLQKKKSFLSLSNSWAPQENLGGVGEEVSGAVRSGGPRDRRPQMPRFREDARSTFVL